jgi:hypothetical protein
MAAKANAAGNGIEGIIQLIKYPPAQTVMNTRPSASIKMGALNFHSAVRGTFLPSLNNRGAMNNSKNNSVSISTCIPRGKSANMTPSAICINGTGIKGIKWLITLDTPINIRSANITRKNSIQTSNFLSHL